MSFPLDGVDFGGKLRIGRRPSEQHIKTHHALVIFPVVVLQHANREAVVRLLRHADHVFARRRPKRRHGEREGVLVETDADRVGAVLQACVPMWAPPGGKGVIDVAQESYKGLNIKVTEFYDGINDNSIMRLDVLFGWAATYPELAVKYAL